MEQNIIAGILMMIIGAVLVIFPKFVWTISESWKSKNNEGPSEVFLIVIKVVGVFIAIAGLVALLS